LLPLPALVAESIVRIIAASAVGNGERIKVSFD